MAEKNKMGELFRQDQYGPEEDPNGPPRLIMRPVPPPVALVPREPWMDEPALPSSFEIEQTPVNREAFARAMEARPLSKNVQDRRLDLFGPRHRMPHMKY
jgi:hypothetical protein